MKTKYRCTQCKATDSDSGNNPPAPVSLICWNCKAGRGTSVEQAFHLRTWLLIVLALVIAGPLRAYPPPQDPNYDGGAGTCFVGCGFDTQTQRAVCIGVPATQTQMPFQQIGYSTCTTYDSSVDHYCTFSNYGCRTMVDCSLQPCAKTPPMDDEAYAWTMVVSLRDHAHMSIEELATWMGDVERDLSLIADKRQVDDMRGEAYRARWNALMPSKTLAPGEVYAPAVRTAEPVGPQM